MHMRRPIRLAAGLAVGAAGIVPVALASPAQAGPGDALPLNIFHVNDSHSRLAPQNGSVDLGTSGGEFDYELGGWPRLQTMIETLEADNTGENNVKVHAGDAITGSLYYTLFGGEADAALMNHTCFDVFEVGNHEFDSSDAGLVEFLDYLNADANDECNPTGPDTGTAVLGANVQPAPGTPLNPDADPAVTTDDYLKPYVIREYTDAGGDAQQVAFIGLDIAQKTKVSSSPLETTEFADEVETAQFYVAELQALPTPVENIVLVTHYQYENDRELAAQVPGIDAIIGGDSHSLLGDPGVFGAFAPETDGDYPTTTTASGDPLVNADGDPVCVAQAWQYTSVVGELNLEFTDGVLTGCEGTPHMLVGEFSRTDDNDETTPITGAELTEIQTIIDGLDGVETVEPDPAAAALLATFSDQVEELEQQVIGTTAEPLCLNRLPGDTRSAGICATDQRSASGARADVHGGFMQQVVTDAFLTRAFNADIALQNAGGVRTALPAGDITVANAYENLPFANTLAEVDLTGAEIVATLESAVGNFIEEGGSDGSYPYGSGIRWDVDLTRPAGERFSNVEVQDRESGAWAPIDPAATYVVATNSFLLGGGDGYAPFKAAADEGRSRDLGLDYAQSWIDWITEDVDGVVAVPAPEEFSTQSFVPVGGELMAPLNPTRVADTRPKSSATVGTTFDGIGEGGGPVVPGTPLVVQIGGRSVVPPTATAVSINVTATEASGQGYFTIWPCDADKPVASSSNFDGGQNIANSVVVPLAADGTVCIDAGVATAHVVVDVTGWSASSPAYTPLVPARLLDTRQELSPTVGTTIDGLQRGQGMLAPGTTLELPVVGRGGVPEGTTAVAINLTSTEAAGAGYLLAWPCDADKPLASTVNYANELAIPNSVVVPLSAEGTLCIETGVAATHIVADVTGAFGETDEFGGVVPARLADTRPQSSATVGVTVDGANQGTGAVPAGEFIEIQVTGRGQAGSLVPEEARLVSINLTATEATGPGYFTAWPCDEERPVASSLNYMDPTAVANSVLVALSDEGTLCVYAGVNSSHLVADVTAYFL